MSATKSQNSINKIKPDKSPYLGRRYQSNDYLSVINNNQIEKIDLDIKYICDRLSEGKVVAIFQGKSESGRRALGNRSIIADPRNPDIRKTMNLKVNIDQFGDLRSNDPRRRCK